MNPNSHETKFIPTVRKKTISFICANCKQHYDYHINMICPKESQTPQTEQQPKAQARDFECWGCVNNSPDMTKHNMGKRCTLADSSTSVKPDDSFFKCPMLRATEKEPAPICANCEIWKEEKPKLDPIYVCESGEHYCGFIKDECPQCKTNMISQYGYTKESVDEVIKHIRYLYENPQTNLDEYLTFIEERLK